MSSKIAIPVMIFLILVLFACTLTNSTTPLAPPTNTASILAVATSTSTLPAATAALVPSITPAPMASATAAASDTPAPTASDTMAPVPFPASSNYIDDRSTPSQVIVSLYNAINRQEYLRAYNYWINPATLLGNFNSYANGFQDTASVDLVFGQITGDPGMS